MQTALAQRYGALLGPLGAAVLFALRHTPADLYWGSGAPAIEWVSRVLQLAGGALAFGWIRHRSGSTVSTWIMHLLGWTYVILVG
jgi:membrane protease YdiL (CAAX protease family)